MIGLSKLLKSLGTASAITIVSLLGVANIEVSAQGTTSVTSSQGTFRQQPNGQILFDPAAGGNSVLVYSGSQRVMAWVGYESGIVTAFSGAGIYYSRDGQNLGGGGNTIKVYSGNQTVRAMIACRSGIFTAFSDAGIYYSPDGKNLGGGGNTEKVYDGRAKVTQMLCRNNEVITSFGGTTYLSPDGKNLGGGGNTVRIN